MPAKPKTPTRRVPSTPKPKSKPEPESQPDVQLDLQGNDNAVAVGPRSFAANVKLIFQGNWKPFAAVLTGVGILLAVILYFVVPKQACNFDKEFTVAVAQLVVRNEAGETISDPAGARLAEAIASDIDSLFKEMHLETVTTYEICTPKQIGLIQSEQEAREFAALHGVTILVYGHVNKFNGEYFVSPHFYVNTTTFKDAQDITGDHEIGKNVPGRLDADMVLAGSPGVQARVDGLSMLTIGLVYYSVDEYDKALEYFQKADQPKWVGSGKETVHLLVGNVYIRAASETKEFEPLLSLAEEAYQSALEINKDYGRALVGMANVDYLRAYTQNDCDPAGLEDASRLLDEALALTDQPASANLETKVHFYRGQIAIIRDYCKIAGSDWRAAAEQEFTWVSERYETDPESDASKSIEYFASHAYARLGYLAYLRNDANAAIAFTQKAIPIAPAKDKADYLSLLGDYYVVVGQKDQASEAYQQALAIAIGNGDAAKAEKFQKKLDDVQGP
jgi:tetratricopeptide (TPR) repeat protein